MQSKFIIAIILCFGFYSFGYAQEEKDEKKDTDTTEELKVETTNVIREPYNPLSPAKAAFYSAVLPGLGQAYNGKYWKIPIIYAALGAGTYFYLNNDKQYKKVRNSYKRRLAGFVDNDEYVNLSTERLIDAQDTLRRDKELALLITIGLYALNIIEANVNAHLLQYNVDDNLSLQPHYELNELDNSGSLGLTLNFKF